MAGPAGQPNLQQLMKQAQQMQQQMMSAQQELAAAQVVGSAGGGLVHATVTGAGDVVSVKIKPEAVDADDVESLEDLVVAAIRDASVAAQQMQAEKMGPLTQGLGGTGGLGLPGM